MSRFFRIIVALITAEAVLLATFQQPAAHESSVASLPKKPKQTSPPPMETMPMQLVAPLFIQDETTDSEVTIVSNFSKSLNVDVVLSGPSGDQLAKKKITMAPYSQKKLRISELLADAQSYPSTTYGSVSLTGDKPASLAAQLSIVENTGSFPVDVEEEFVMLMDPKPANYRAVASGLLAMPALGIRSLSKTDQEVSISCLMDGGRIRKDNIVIAPNQTLLVQACNERGIKKVERPNKELNIKQDSPKAVGISVSSSAPSEELAVFGIGRHGKAAKEALSAIPFWDLNTLASPNAIYSGLPTASQATSLGQQSFKLRAAIANFSSTAKNATVLLASGSGADNTQKTITTLNLRPQTVSAVDLADVLPDALATNSLVVQTDGSPGEVLSSIQAVSTSSVIPAVLTLPWKDQAQFENGGEHPWTANPSVSSTILLFNPDPAIKNSSVQLTIHTDKTTWTKQFSLPSLATAALSINDIIQKQQPDDRGVKLPVNSSEGIVTWSTLSKPRVFGKLVQTDEFAGISRSYACGSISSVCSVAVQDPYPNPFLVGQQTSVSGFPLGCTGDSPCSCNDSCGSGSGGGSMSWDSENPGIASVISSSYGSGTYQGNSGGQTWADASVTDNNGCSASGSASMTVVDFNTSYPNLNGIVSVSSNPDGSFTATMSTDELANFSGNAQEYFQSECGCPDYGGIIDDLRAATIAAAAAVTLTTLKAMNDLLSFMNRQSPEAHNTPVKGQPNSVTDTDKSKPGSPGRTVRVFGSDGRAVRDIDYGNQAHSGNDPEVHDWTWDSNGNPSRSDPGRAPQPGDIPPGY